MQHPKVRRGVGLAVAVLTLGLISAACTPAPYAGPPTANLSFKATHVVVNSSNDKTCVLGICAGANDEPYVINIGFNVTLGVANSANAHAVVGSNHWSGIFDQGPGEGGSYDFVGSEQGQVDFTNVATPDVADLVQGAHLEIAGVWAWKMEADLLGVSGLATTAASAIQSVLNSTLANTATPSDANSIVSILLSAISNNVFPALGGFLASVVPFAGDDAMGSAFYVGVGASGTLSNIIESATSGISFPSLSIPVLTDPPDIGGGAIFSLGVPHSFTNNFTNGGVSGQHTTTYTFQ